MAIINTSTFSTVNSPIEIVQCTDLHFIHTPEENLWDINPYANFSLVLQEAIAQYPCAKLLLLTGDLVHNPAVGAYRLLRDCLVGLNYPIFRLP